MTSFCPGISTEAISSIDPAALERGLCINAAMPQPIRITTTPIATIFTGGRFFFAVPNSSPMRKSDPGWAEGVAAVGFGLGAGGGKLSGIVDYILGPIKG